MESKSKKQVLYDEDRTHYQSLRDGRWYDVISEDGTCYTLLNEFGNECRYRKESFVGERFRTSAPSDYSDVVAGKITKVIFKDKSNDPNSGPIGTSNIYEVDSETAGYYFIKIHRSNGSTYVYPYRKELFRPFQVASVSVVDSMHAFNEAMHRVKEHANKLAATMERRVHTLAVVFPSSSKRYNYLSTVIPKGDYVIVDAPSTGYTVVKVVRIYRDTILHPAYKYIVDVVDDAEYKQVSSKLQELENIKRQVKQSAETLQRNVPEEYLRARYRRFDALCTRRDLLEAELVRGTAYGDCDQ